MENATKALIIAGAILVAILLVTMGIALLNNIGGLDEESKKTSNSMNVSSFNGKLTPAEGNTTGDRLSGVLDEVYMMYVNDKETQLTVTYGSVTAAPGDSAIENIKKIQKSIKDQKRYTVTLDKDDTSGYIDTMTIVDRK